jgi:hypothetical protein
MEWPSQRSKSLRILEALARAQPQHFSCLTSIDIQSINLLSTTYSFVAVMSSHVSHSLRFHHRTSSLEDCWKQTAKRQTGPSSYLKGLEVSSPLSMLEDRPYSAVT